MNRCSRVLPLKRSSFQQKTGFTLVELIIYMGLYTVLLSILTSVLISVLEVHIESQTAAAVEQEGRYLLQRVHHDLLRSTQVTNPSAVNPTSSSLEFVVDGVQYRYTHIDTVLTLSRGIDVNRLHSLETLVTSFTVQRIGTATGTPSFRISIVLDDAHTAHQDARVFETTIGGRL